MKYVSTMILAAALLAPSALASAAPRTIDDCEKIEAADAYNQCLAAFGPVAHGHSGGGAQVQDVSDSTDGDAVQPESGSSGQRVAHASGHSRHHAGRHGWTRHAHGPHGRHSRAADHAHGHGKRLAFTITPSHTHLR
ncbi:hypothetical protein [Methylocapsa acidiphila]|uniref:hypothetical protein n=1 Tax=Methylocapsa acidiphila TaxID=133552 RepID=UPI0004123921|nr:hypothetical protein [Methylocapsa acidiphila]